MGLFVCVSFHFAPWFTASEYPVVPPVPNMIRHS